MVVLGNELGAGINLENGGTVKEVRKLERNTGVLCLGNDFVLGVNMIEGH